MTTADALPAMSLVNLDNLTYAERCPWGKAAGWTIGVLFVLMVVCVILDRDASKVLEALSWLTLAAAAVTDRQGMLRRRIVPVAVALIAVVLVSAVAAWFEGEFPAAVYAFVKYQVGVIWLAVLWLAAPVFLERSWRELNFSDDNRRAGRWREALIAVLMLFALHVTISAAASMYPKESMKLLGGEILPYAGLFIVITRAANCTRERWLKVSLRGAWLVVVATCIGMAVVALLALVSPSLADAMLEQDFFRVDSDAPDTRRLQFLFHHHNRAGFFAACGIYLCLAGTAGRRWWRVLGIAGAVAAGIALPFTLTRGALVAAGAGAALFVVVGVLRNRRARWPALAAIVVAMPLVWFLLPDSYSDHIAKIANPQNYREGEGGSIGARLVMWETAADMIERRPGLGFGYGFENFVSAAQADHPEKPGFFEDAAHAHNMWLETAAENGIAGAVLLLAFTLVRLAGLATAWWRSARRQSWLATVLLLWMSLEVVVLVYGLTNYPLRRNLGFLSYWIWAGSALLVLAAAKADSFGQRDEPMEMPKF